MNKQQLLANVKRQISITDIAIFRLMALDTSSLPETTQKALINLTDYIVSKQINIRKDLLVSGRSFLIVQIIFV